MDIAMNVLVAGRKRQEIDAIAAMVARLSGTRCATRLIENGHIDPLYGLQELPDILVFGITENWEDELNALGARPPAERPPVLVVGSGGHVGAMRKAMHIGARDFFSYPPEQGEFRPVFEQLYRDLRQQRKGIDTAPRCLCVLGAKGGVGASTVAANLAHTLAAVGELRVALADLDLDLGSLPLFFDLKPAGGLIEAVEQVESIDRVAIEGFMLKHTSGVHLLSAAGGPRMAEAIPEQRLERLVSVLREGYDRLVADLPRRLDSATASLLHGADHVLMVMEQGVDHLHAAQRTYDRLTADFAVAPEHIEVVVNRWNKRAAVDAEAIADALGIDKEAMHRLPNDYASAFRALQLGVPLAESARGAALTKGIERLAREIGDLPRRRRGLLGLMWAS